MPYKRDGSPNYYVRRRSLPGYGDTGRLSSGVSSKKIAGDMERLIEEIARRALVDPTWYRLLDAVCKDRTLRLPELLRAKNTGALQVLKKSLHDPLLSEAVEAYRQATDPKKAVRVGLKYLLDYAPKGARLSYLEARTITELCYACERGGRKRNSVRRYLLRAISLLLRFHLGSAERNRLFTDVRFPAEDDTREVHLSPAEIARLVAEAAAIEGELSLIIRLALLTSADRGVLLSGWHVGKEFRGLRVRDVRVFRDIQTGQYSGEVYLFDTKTESRSRSVPLTDSMCRELMAQTRGKGPDEPVFSIEYRQLDYLWRRARAAAGLKHVRFKDLRAQVSIYGEEAGIPQTVLQRTMGHSDAAMTRRYQARAAAMSTDQAEAIEAAMFRTPDDSNEQPRRTG